MAIVETGGLFVCHLVGHLFSIIKLLLFLKDRTKVSSLLGNLPALPAKGAPPDRIPHSPLCLLMIRYSHCVGPALSCAPVSVVSFLYSRETWIFIWAQTCPDTRLLPGLPDKGSHSTDPADEVQAGVPWGVPGSLMEREHVNLCLSAVLSILLPGM